MPAACTPWHARGCWLATEPDPAGRYALRQAAAPRAALVLATADWPATTTVLLVGGPAASRPRKQGDPRLCC